MIFFVQYGQVKMINSAGKSLIVGTKDELTKVAAGGEWKVHRAGTAVRTFVGDIDSWWHICGVD